MQQPVVHALQRGAIGAQRTHDAGDAAHSYGESITARKDVVRVGGAAPPAAGRCSARASLRAPSRGDPPRRAIRGRDPRQADRFGTWNVRGGRSPIKRGVGRSEERRVGKEGGGGWVSC